jgi:hypothetical protein
MSIDLDKSTEKFNEINKCVSEKLHTEFYGNMRLVKPVKTN